MGYVQDSIKTFLDAIKTAVYGEDVRGSIHDAIKTIADGVDVQMTSLATIQTSAQSIVNGYENNKAVITTALNKAGELSTALNELQDSIDDFTTPEVTELKYVESNSQWVAEGTPGLAYDRERGKFVFSFVAAPAFNKNVDFTVDDLATSPSGNYNPNTGLFSITIPNLIKNEFRNIQFAINNIAPNDQNVYPSEPSASYNPNTGVLTMNIRQGKNGTSALEAIETLVNRPFIMDDLYVNNQLAQTPSGNCFGMGSVVSRDHVLNLEEDAIIFPGANDFDAVFIIFRKTVDNNSGFSLNKNFSSKTSQSDIDKEKNTVFMADNTDYDSTVTVFLRKPSGKPGDKRSTAMASFIDAKNRIITRKVHWISENHHQICSGGATKTYPVIGLEADSDHNSETPAGIQVGEAFTNAFIFENAIMKPSATTAYKAVDHGDAPEWVWTALNTYSADTFVNSSYNPVVNKINNRRFNQCLIPIRIIGISFGMSNELVDMYKALQADRNQSESNG